MELSCHPFCCVLPLGVFSVVESGRGQLLGWGIAGMVLGHKLCVIL